MTFSFKVMASTGKSTSTKAKGGSFSVSASDSSGAAIAATSEPFQFIADFSGASTLTPLSASSDVRAYVKSTASNFPLPKMTVRSAMSLMFCSKALSNCPDADWVAESGSTITGATVTHSTTKFGTYVLHGSDGYVASTDVAGTPNKSPSSGSTSSTISVVVYLAVTALAHLCI
jgi:hypothetical protein